MKAETVHKKDKPEDSIESIIFTDKYKGIYTAYLHISPYPVAEIEAAPQIDHLFLKDALETILAQAIEPHDRFSYKFHISLIIPDESDILDIYDEIVTGITVLSIKIGIEIRDTFIPYTKRYAFGSISICKGYFKNKIVFSRVNGSLTEEEINETINYSPEYELAQIKQLLQLNK